MGKEEAGKRAQFVDWSLDQTAFMLPFMNDIGGQLFQLWFLMSLQQCGQTTLSR